MCVIVIKPAGRVMLRKQELKEMHLCNPHGMGFVCESLGTYKTLDFEDFWRHVKRVKRSEVCVIHFRYATHGSVCADNCHPFTHDGVSFVHNGILSTPPRGDMTDSETAFVDYFLPVLKRHGLYSPELAWIVSRKIGYSKFVFYENGQIRTFGRFTEYDGCFYSNLNHLHFARWVS